MRVKRQRRTDRRGQALLVAQRKRFIEAPVFPRPTHPTQPLQFLDDDHLDLPQQRHRPEDRATPYRAPRHRSSPRAQRSSARSVQQAPRTGTHLHSLECGPRRHDLARVLRPPRRLRDVHVEPPSAAEILAQIASDPNVLADLRGLVLADVREAAPAYTVATLATALGVTERVVRNAIGRGELAAVKRGARWLISPEAVDAWAHGERHLSRKTRRIAQTRQPLTSAFAQIGNGARRSA
jgi:excisionase family DNA binding protein